MILQAISAGHIYGYTVMEVTGLPSGTVYPALRRMDRDRLIRSHWERQSLADAEQRPPRKYYRLTRSGETHRRIRFFCYKQFCTQFSVVIVN